MRLRTYCLPVRLMVATRISEAVPIIMPSAVSRKRTLLERKVSKAKLKISPKMTWGLGRAAVATAVGIKLVRCYLGVGGSGKGNTDASPCRTRNLCASADSGLRAIPGFLFRETRQL